MQRKQTARRLLKRPLLRKAPKIPVKKPKFLISEERSWTLKDKVEKVNNRLPEAKLRYPCLVLRDRSGAPRFVLAYKPFSIDGKSKVAITVIQRERTQYTKISDTLA